MNLLYVVDRFPRVSETFVLHEIQELRRQGDRVDVCSRRPLDPRESVHAGAEEIAAGTIYLSGGTKKALGLALAVLAALAGDPRRALSALRWSVAARLYERGALRAFAEAAYLHRRLPPGVEHVHAHFAHGSATVALLLARLTGLPFSFTGHGSDLLVSSRPRLLRRKVAEARFVTVVSEFTRSHVAGIATPADRAKVVRVPSAVDVATFPRSQPARQTPPLVLTVARLEEEKGLDVAVEAARILAERGLAVRWEIVGDGSLRESLAEQTRAAGVEARLTLTGALGHAAVRERYARATVFALPSRREALSVAILEAMAAGVPVVTTAVGGSPEIVRDGESGLLVPPDDPVSLAGALERALGDPALRARLAEAGRRVAESHDLGRTVASLRHLFGSGPP